MKILLIMDPGILVPPKGYGGHERLVAMFAEEYKRLGHEVHLLVTTGSFIEGCTMHPFGNEGFPPGRKEGLKAIPRAWNFLKKHRHEFDLVHNFGRLAYLLPILNDPVKKIMTYGREINRKNARISNVLPHRNIVFTGCSRDLLSRVALTGNWEVVYNAINFENYNLQPWVPENAPLIFLGRIERVKGCHHAIKVALATGQNLIIAGNISPLIEEQKYFKTEIEPYIDDQQIKYVGQVDDAQKNHYLGKAKALLFPIQWEEPFGMVMVEAMASGTPVIGFRNGSVPEVIDEGITGFMVNTNDEMAASINRLHEIDREKCRLQAASRFDVRIIAQQYLGLLSDRNRIVIATSGQPSANPRVVKEAITLDKAGYRVTVIYAPLSPWADEFDKTLFAETPTINWIRAGLLPGKQPLLYKLVRLRRKLYEWSFKYAKGLSIAHENAFVIYSPELKRMAIAIKAELYIAHNLGALPAAVLAARKWNALSGFDAEDYHRGETPSHSLFHHLAVKIENKYIPHINYFSAASPLIASAYSRLFGNRKVIPINNVFSIKHLQPIHATTPGELSMFWFSQKIGTTRGLENVISTLNYLKECNISLHVLGNCTEEYKHHLLGLTEKPKSIHFLEPVAPEKIFEIAANFDVGLATEIPHSENRQICLTNKIFTYVLAGNCILSSNTLAQKEFMEDYEGIGLVYKNNDPSDLAEKIKYLYENPLDVLKYRKHSLEVAETSLNWEIESQKFLNLIEETLKSRRTHQTINLVTLQGILVNIICFAFELW
jgi:glycosyltransferase involved in cell wall biosynthesis